MTITATGAQLTMTIKAIINTISNQITHLNNRNNSNPLKTKSTPSRTINNNNNRTITEN
jgi:hypothetical protein